MAPQRVLKAATNKTTLLPLARKGIATRSQNIQDQNHDPTANRAKRKADISPLKNDKIKRSALGNLTNNVVNLHIEDDKKHINKKHDVNASKNAVKNSKAKTDHTICQNKEEILCVNKILTRAAVKNASVVPTNLPVTTVVKTKESTAAADIAKATTRRISNEFEKTEDSLYMSALEDVPSSDSVRLSGNFDAKRQSLSQNSSTKTDSDASMISATNSDLGSENSPKIKKNEGEVPEGVIPFDKENWDDPLQVSHYALDIFQYLKDREPLFAISDYMTKQVHLSKGMRSLLVDWMVEVQETFELNHETLYLAVKIVDLYLGKVIVQKDKLQLLGAAALFISCKFDERTPPLVDDFLYICDGAYNQTELIKMEMDVLRTIDFDLGIPLSYRFLRRYARCAKVPMPTLTLARYVLEFSLMDYATVLFSDSQMACAALFIALRMTGTANPWNKTLEYYSGYKLEDFASIIPILNNGLHRKPKDTIKTVRNKYSHVIFYEVAKLPLLTNEELFHKIDLTNVQ